jgi:hypothetical protein
MTGDPVLVPLGDRWLLAHVTPFGLQTSVENFPSASDGIAHVEAIERRLPAVEAGGERLSPRECALLLALAAGPLTNAEAARKVRTSYRASLPALCRLGAAGLAQAEGARIGLTAEGIALARAMREP